jgi:molecular chaperone GrpE
MTDEKLTEETDLLEDELLEDSDSEFATDGIDETPGAAFYQSEITRLSKERDTAREEMLRALAEMQNFRRLTEQRQIQERRFATERFVRELLPVVDNFERTLRHLEAGATVEQLSEGVKAVHRQLLVALESQDVRPVVKVGDKFDPEFHEAIATGQQEGAEEGQILDVIESGFKMGDRVVRPAKVRVAQ